MSSSELIDQWHHIRSVVQDSREAECHELLNEEGETKGGKGKLPEYCKPSTRNELSNSGPHTRAELTTILQLFDVEFDPDLGGQWRYLFNLTGLSVGFNYFGTPHRNNMVTGENKWEPRPIFRKHSVEIVQPKNRSKDELTILADEDRDEDFGYAYPEPTSDDKKQTDGAPDEVDIKALITTGVGLALASTGAGPIITSTAGEVVSLLLRPYKSDWSPGSVTPNHERNVISWDIEGAAQHEEGSPLSRAFHTRSWFISVDPTTDGSIKSAVFNVTDKTWASDIDPDPDPGEDGVGVKQSSKADDDHEDPHRTQTEFRVTVPRLPKPTEMSSEQIKKYQVIPGNSWEKDTTICSEIEPSRLTEENYTNDSYSYQACRVNPSVSWFIYRGDDSDVN